MCCGRSKSRSKRGDVATSLPLGLVDQRLRDVSRGQLVTLDNFETLFKDAFNPKQLEGLRLLLTPFPQAQFNH